MQTYFSAHILEMQKERRTHFINSLGGFKSVSLVGTTNNLGQNNLSVFSSLVHIGAHPPLVALIFRPRPPERDTFRNIMELGFYTVNHINSAIFKKAHQTAARYDKDISEFDAAGLSPIYKNEFKAPFVAESAVQIGIAFREKIDITINRTTMVIGEIVQVHFPEDCLSSDGFLDLEKAKTITCSGLDSYHTTTKLSRLSYPKTDRPVAQIHSEFSPL